MLVPSQQQDCARIEYEWEAKMKRHPLIILFIVIFVLSLSAETESFKKDPVIEAAFIYLDSLIDSLRIEQNIPGLSVAVVFDQEMVWAKGFGLADMEKKIPAGSKTIYRIASITKLFTATMLMQLRDKDKLQLDDPLIEYIPGFKIKSPFKGTRPITLRQIASHSSGLPREAPLDYMKTLEFPAIEEILESLKEAELIFKPLTEFKYSNVGISLLGYALESISNQSYREYITENILNPLGMTGTVFEINADLQPYLAVGYIPTDDGKSFQTAPLYDMKGMSPCGQLYSNVEDVSRFMSFQFHEQGAPQDDILSRVSIDEMQNIEIMDSKWEMGMGIGWAIIRDGDEILVGHSGGTHGYQTNIFLAPKLKIGVAAFSNNTNSNPGKISKEILGVLIPLIKRIQAQNKKAQKSDALVEEWKKYVGIYVWEELGQQIEIKIKDNDLIVTSPNDPNLIVYLAPEKEHVFRMKEGPFSGELLKFQVDESGKVIEAWLGNYCFVRK